MRALLERLGARVIWNEQERTVYALNGEHQVMVTVGSRQAWNDGWKMRMDVPAEIRQDRTFLPLRFTAEAMGAAVAWDPASRTARINRKHETEFEPEDLDRAAATLTPYVTMDQSNRFRLSVPDAVWLAISPSAFRQLRESMVAINKFTNRISEDALTWEPFDGDTRLAMASDNAADFVQNSNWGQEPVFALVDQNPNRAVRVYWWLTKWYVDDDTANEIQWQLTRNGGAESFAAYVLSKFPALAPFEVGIATSAALIGLNSAALTRCINQSKGRGVVVYVLFPRNYGWCKAR